MARQYDNRGRDQINIEQVQGNVVLQQQQFARSRKKWVLLQQVEQEVTSRLEQSLNNMVLINLGKQAQPEKVKRSWEMEIKIGSKPAEPLPCDISILEIFERVEIVGKLLILGEPGAGKTTTLLELAQALVEKAKQDISYPIPVLVNLSSWKNPHQLMTDWLVEELDSKYGVPEAIAIPNQM